MNAPTDLAALKSRQQAAWASGDYAVIGTTLQIVGEQLAEACDLRCGRARPRRRRRQRQRDAGRGAPRLPRDLDRLRRRAARARRRARARRAAARSSSRRPTSRRCRSTTRSFDAVLSTFGVMFAPDHAKAAAEMARVCRPGGRIGLANWTPEGFIGQLFKTLGRHVPPPPGVQSPALWGTRGAPARRCSATGRGDRGRRRACSTSAIARRRTSSTSSAPGTGRCTRRSRRCRPRRAPALERDLTELIDGSTAPAPDSLVVPSEYLEIVGARGADMEARVQRRVQRYGWDLAAPDYERLWQAQLGPAQADDAGARRRCAPGERVLDVACGTGLVVVRRRRRRRRQRPRARRRHVRRDGRRARNAVPTRTGVGHAAFARMDAEALDLGRREVRRRAVRASA